MLFGFWGTERSSSIQLENELWELALVGVIPSRALLLLPARNEGMRCTHSFEAANL